MRRLLMILFAAVMALAGRGEEIELAPAIAKTPPKLAGNVTAPQILRACREMLPPGAVELTGALVLRNRKGIVSREYGYRLVMRHDADASLLTVKLTPRGETNELANVTVSRRGDARPTIRLRKPGAAEEEVATPLAAVMDTDVTWLDLTFDFLWWNDAAFETEREGETVHGQKCLVILVKPPAPVAGLEAVRLWVDRKTGCLMQAEQLGAGLKPLRRLWGTRVKKFDNRWMVSVLEVETLGKKHRTKITVEGLKDL